MSQTTRFKCPNCDERRSVVAPDDVTSTAVTCPNCDEGIIVSFE